MEKNIVPTLEYFDFFSNDDQQKMIDFLVRTLNGEKPPSLLTRKVAKISSLGSDEEIRKSIADQLEIPLDQLPPINLDEIRKETSDNWLSVKKLIDPFLEMLKSNPKNTPDKYQEIFDLGKFIISSKLDIQIIVPEKPLPYPDFTVLLEGNLVSIEHTRLIKPQEKAVIATAKLFISSAHKLLIRRHPTLVGTVNVFINFEASVLGDKNFNTRGFTLKERNQITLTICDYIESVLLKSNNVRPSFISAIRVSGNLDQRLDIELGEEYVAKDGFKDLLLDRIKAKEDNYLAYVNQAETERCWLFVVIDGISSYSGFDLENEIFLVDKSPFELIILFEAFSEKSYVIYNKDHKPKD